MPWTTYFEKEAGPEKTPDANEGGKEETKGEKMLVWRNEEFGNLGDIKKGAKEERPTWAGRNPMSAYKIGKSGKNLTGEVVLHKAPVSVANPSGCLFSRCHSSRCRR